MHGREIIGEPIPTPGAAATWRRTLAFAALIAVLVALGGGLRLWAGIELEPASIRAQIDALGWRGPAVFVSLVTFRQFLLLPAFLLLSVGGLVFGTLAGAALGALGIVLSAAIALLIARRLAPNALPVGLRGRLARFEAGGHRLGLWLVGVATAHPAGPLTFAHWVAAFSTVAVSGLLVTVALASLVRAGLVSAFGAALRDWGSPQSTAALIALALVLAPLAHPAVRARVFALVGPRR